MAYGGVKLAEDAGCVELFRQEPNCVGWHEVDLKYLYFIVGPLCKKSCLSLLNLNLYYNLMAHTFDSVTTLLIVFFITFGGIHDSSCTVLISALSLLLCHSYKLLLRLVLL